jgi:predicted GNAT family acetyltransferase
LLRRHVLRENLRVPTTPNIVHNTAARRFETRVDGWLCRAEYQVHDNVVHLVHTEVAHAVEGRGIAAALVRTALAWADEQKMTVVPRCSFVRLYMDRHPEYAHLRA